MNHPRTHLVAASSLSSPGRGAHRSNKPETIRSLKPGHPPGRASGMQKRASLLLDGRFHSVGTLGVRTPACASMPVAECFTYD